MGNIVAEIKEITSEDIDAVLVHGSGMYLGKYRIYEQYLKKESAEKNIDFLKKEYGIGGSYPAVLSLNLDESHDAKGLKISRGVIAHPTSEVFLTWNKVEKRIKRLIENEDYLTRKELANYPAYKDKEEEKRTRKEISEEIKHIVLEYNSYMQEKGREEKIINYFYVLSCCDAFTAGDTKVFNISMEGNSIFPLLKEALNLVSMSNTPLKARCKAAQRLLLEEIEDPLKLAG